ncbi:protein NipSnap-like isoform X1 [Littorina saxatilis]|uniref:NIPSNAP domain-containing protein n=1 Tax=Littorina saxatilis TaxID=31220 RepID=A0AAN9AKT5_9CAEN
MAAMAGLSRRLFRPVSCLPSLQGWQGPISARFMSKKPPQEQDSEDENKAAGSGDEKKRGWLTNLLSVRTLEPSRESHSMQLSSKETVYEIQFHAVKPDCMEDYLNQFKIFKQLMDEKKAGSELIGSWTVEIGDQDEAIHIWSYKGGYPVLNEANRIYRTDQDFIEFRKNRNKMLRYRKNQILLAFSFWPELKPRPPSNIYELRSYTLKPGTMIEWGNNWARGIKSRGTNNEPVAGYFSQMGDLYMVHHIWAYTDLESRKQTREAAWQRPGWDECVAYTVPLIRHMQSRILIPTPFSPLM